MVVNIGNTPINVLYWKYSHHVLSILYMGMGQYLLIPFLGGWTSIYQLFWCSPGVQGFDTLPYECVNLSYLLGMKWILALIQLFSGCSRSLSSQLSGVPRCQILDNISIEAIIYLVCKGLLLSRFGVDFHIILRDFRCCLLVKGWQLGWDTAVFMGIITKSQPIKM